MLFLKQFINYLVFIWVSSSGLGLGFFVTQRKEKHNKSKNKGKNSFNNFVSNDLSGVSKCANSFRLRKTLLIVSICNSSIHILLQ